MVIPDEPIIFLAGPIQGALDWQSEAISIIHTIEPNIVVANPRRQYLDETFDYDAQVEWELCLLHEASGYGCIIFWLANEAVHHCQRPFAKTTRVEFGFFMAKHQILGSNIAVGFDVNFSGKDYFTHLIKKYGHGLSIHHSLERTCRAAIEICRQLDK